jgi:hypothetical protein
MGGAGSTASTGDVVVDVISALHSRRRAQFACGQLKEAAVGIVMPARLVCKQTRQPTAQAALPEEQCS